MGILLLALAGIGYFVYRGWSSSSGDDAPPGVLLQDGAQTFTPEAKVAILAALPMLALEQVAEVNGAKTYRVVATGSSGPNAGAQFEVAVKQGQIVGASVAFLSTEVAEHFVAIAFPIAGMREKVAFPGSPMALLHDPLHPGL